MSPHERRNGPPSSYTNNNITPTTAPTQVRRGTVPDPSTGGKESGTETLRASCPKSDLYKSFSLILKDRR